MLKFRRNSFVSVSVLFLSQFTFWIKFLILSKYWRDLAISASLPLSYMPHIVNPMSNSEPSCPETYAYQQYPRNVGYLLMTFRRTMAWSGGVGGTRVLNLSACNFSPHCFTTLLNSYHPPQLLLLLLSTLPHMPQMTSAQYSGIAQNLTPKNEKWKKKKIGTSYFVFFCDFGELNWEFAI